MLGLNIINNFEDFEEKEFVESVSNITQNKNIFHKVSTSLNT